MAIDYLCSTPSCLRRSNAVYDHIGNQVRTATKRPACVWVVCDFGLNESPKRSINLWSAF